MGHENDTRPYERFKCRAPGNYLSVPEQVTCNGIPDCLDGEDEAVELCERSGRFFCLTRNGSAVSCNVHSYPSILCRGQFEK